MDGWVSILWKIDGKKCHPSILFLNSWVLSFNLLADNTTEQHPLSHKESPAQSWVLMFCPVFLKKKKIKGWYKEIKTKSLTAFITEDLRAASSVSIQSLLPRTQKNIPFENFFLKSRARNTLLSWSVSCLLLSAYENDVANCAPSFMTAWSPRVKLGV